MKRLWLLAVLAAVVVEPGGVAAQEGPGCPELTSPQLRVTGAEYTVADGVVTVQAAVDAPCSSTDPTNVTAGGTWTSAQSAPVRRLKGRGDDVTVPIRLEIAAGATGTQELVVSVPPGSQKTGDETITEDESLLGDNELRRMIQLPGPDRAPDLTVQEADEPSRTTGGGRIVVAALVRNTGDLEAPATTATIAADWRTGEPQEVKALAPDEQVRIETTFDVPAERLGTSEDFEVAVEPVDGETDTEDNTRTIPVRLPDPPSDGPDIAIGALRLVEQADPGRAVLVAVVRNEGDEPTPRTAARLTPGWGEAVRLRLPELAAAGRTRLRFGLAVPEDAQGKRRSFTLAIRPVAGEEDTADNRSRIVRGLIATDEQGFPLWVIPAGLLALAAAGALAHRLWRPGPPPPVPQRAIRTGFEDADGRKLEQGARLVPGDPYAFWLELGPPVAAAGAGELIADVVLTPLAGALAPEDGADRATVDLAAAGYRVLIPLRWRDGGGAPALRCSVCVAGAIVWSKRIPVRVTRTWRRPREEVDYAIAPRLDAGRLAALPRHDLALLLNDDGQGSHVFTFIGAGEYHTTATIDVLEVQQHVDALRGALRRAAWGAEAEWRPGMEYRYRRPDPDRAHADLIRLAVVGYRAYSSLAMHLARTPEDDFRLAGLMRTPGLVQIAVKESARLHFPAALLYDQPLDTGVREPAFRICPEFAAASSPGAPLHETACFQGECPHAEDLLTVCPSGFWGYRHDIGTPLSARENEDVPGEIALDDPAALLLAVSTDEKLELREDHEAAIRRLAGPLACHRAATREDTLRGLADQTVRIVYFYCHGGLAGSVPYLQVGPAGESVITADLLRAKRVRWSAPGRPLVFINGCRTTAVEPRLALEFVGAWLRTAQAGGVVGTDITVFEPLATRFAVACLSRFMSGMPLGRAVRLARLELLAAHDPLALAYVAFALPSLRGSHA